MIHKIIVDHIYSRIEGELDASLSRKLYKLCAFHPKGYQFMPSYRQMIYEHDKEGNIIREYRAWDGYISFFRKDSQVFHTGFLKHALTLFKDEKIKYKVIDNRKFPSVSSKISLRLNDNEKGHIQLRDYQIKALKRALKQHRGIIKAATGCLAGDTEIRYNRNKVGRAVTIKRFYEAFNQIKRGYDLSKPTYVRSYNGKTVNLYEMQNVIYSGIQDVYQLILEDNHSIKTTKNHQFLTNQGWKELQDLTQDDYILCDTLKPQKKVNKYKKRKKKQVWNLWYHPYAIKIKMSHKKSKPYTKRIELHRAIYEAHINNITLDQYKYILRTDEQKSKTLKFINPKLYDIHHKDGNHNNNLIQNLIALDKIKHQRIHSKTNKFNFHQGVIKKVKIRSIQYIGKEDTYDIQCKYFPNFIANNMIVHNSGKTEIAASIIKNLDQPTLYFVHQQTLALQTKERFEERLGCKIGLIGIGKFQPEKISIAMIETFWAQKHTARIKKLMKEAKILMVDECHHLRAQTWSKLANKIKAPYRYGLSATPNIKGEGKKLIAVTGDLLIDISSNKLIKKGYLAKPLIKIYKFKCDEIDGDYQTVRQEGIVYNYTRNEGLINALDRYIKKKKSILILITEIEHGQILSDMIIEKYEDIKIEYLYGKDSANKRKKIIEKFKKKEIDILIGSVIFDEGVDIPSLEILELANGYKSRRMNTQRVGRSLRRTKDKDKVIIIDVYDDHNKYLLKHSKERIKNYKKNKFKIKMIKRK